MAPTPEQLRAVLVEILSDSTTKPEAHWRTVIGSVTKRPSATEARSNWEISPTGSDYDCAAAARAMEIVRREHPYVGD